LNDEFKMATGSGKTKVMSLAIVWSYYHAVRENQSPLARHFVVIAPNLTVFERLKEDFKPEGGGPDIFDSDPLIPVEWRGDWNLTVVLQDEAGGAATGSALYLGAGEGIQLRINSVYAPLSQSQRRTRDAGPSRVMDLAAAHTTHILPDRVRAHFRE
jgi:type III restriction enzyme